MQLRHYIWLLAAGSILGWITWGFIIWSVAPAEAGLAGWLFFYLSLGLALFGTTVVAGFLMRRAVATDEAVVLRHVKNIFRNGLIISGVIILLLILQAEQLLNWWNALLVVGAVVTGVRKFTAAKPGI